jgi:AcrR family transcriptional regulator
VARQEVTQLALLRAAEKLFAAHGVDAVSMREIAALAGQRNHSAALYHFGDKRALLDALLERHSAPVDAGFAPAIEALQAEGRETLETLVAVLTRPMVELVADEDGGVEYVTICAELVHSRTFPMTSMRAANGPGSQVLRQRLFAHMQEVPPLLLPVRMMQVTALLFGSIAAYQRLCSAGLFIPRPLFSDDLVRTMSALLAPPPG